MAKHAVTLTVKRQAAEHIAKLAAALEEGQSEELITCLERMSSFHRYSLTNALLIQQQRPSATRVAGFRQWKRVGRWVKKGERGIKILVPFFRQKEDDREVEERSSVYFGVGHVFDIEQTEGEPLPDINKATGDPGVMLDRVRGLIHGEGIILDEAAPGLGTAKASARRDRSTGQRYIDTTPGCAASEQFALLVHELAHQRLHLSPDAEPTDTQTKEAEAEAVSYVVCMAVGVDASLSAKDYLQSWRVDAGLLQASLTKVQLTAASIIETLTANQAASVAA